MGAPSSWTARLGPRWRRAPLELEVFYVRYLVAPEDVEPGWKLTGEFDLSGTSLPSNEILGRTPGQYVISPHFSSSGAAGTWSGSVWSNPVQVVVEECD